MYLPPLSPPPFLTFHDAPTLPRRYSDPGYSYNSLLGRLMVFATDAELCRQTMNFNDPSKLVMQLHPSARTVLGDNNLAFTNGEVHKALRWVGG